MLLLIPSRLGRKEISRQKKALKIKGLVFPIKIGVTYRSKAERLKEIQEGMAAYGKVIRIPLAYFWMFYYKHKEYRLLHRQWKARQFYPDQAGQGGGKDEWRLLRVGEVWLTYLMLFSHCFVFIAANLALISGFAFFFLPDQAQGQILQECLHCLDLLLSGIKYIFGWQNN